MAEKVSFHTMMSQSVPVLLVDESGYIRLAPEIIEQLTRIDQKLDELLSHTVIVTGPAASS